MILSRFHLTGHENMHNDMQPTLAQLEERETVMGNHLEVACSSQAGRILFFFAHIADSLH